MGCHDLRSVHAAERDTKGQMLLMDGDDPDHFGETLAVPD